MLSHAKSHLERHQLPVVPSTFATDDVTIAAVPFFRTGGTGVNVLPVLFKGGTVVVPRSTDPDEDAAA